MITDSNRLFCNAVFAAIVASCLAGCADTSVVETKPAEVSVAMQAPASIPERAAAVALKQIGTAYRYGGSSPAGFDCSGLVQYSYLEAGKTVPRTTRQLWNTAGTVPYDDLQVGDLVMIHVGNAIQKMSEEEAKSAWDLYDEILDLEAGIPAGGRLAAD